MQTKTELTLEQTQQGVNDEVLLLSSIEDSHHGPSDAMHNPSPATQEHQSDTKVFTMTMEILPEPTSNKLCGSCETLSRRFFRIIPDQLERITKKRTKNKAKTTKLDSEWKSCEGQSQSRAKDQKSQSQSQLNKLTVKTGAVIEEYYWLQSQPI
ncbi:hypothetical protein Tco_0299343 [Tanacetum coccineum]